MLRISQVDIEGKPRKKTKLDTIHSQQYDQFKGQAIEIQKNETSYPPQKCEKQLVNVNDEIKAYQKIFRFISKNPRANKKLKKNHQQQPQKISSTKRDNKKLQVKDPHSIKQKQQSESKQKQQCKQKVNQISSNWKKFLSQQTKKPQKQKQAEFIAIDCQFVKSNQEQCLARVSLVNQKGQQVYDAYVKPNKKITDFVTQISGITFSHIKNALPQAQVISQVKKILLNKIIIGHTTKKDLEICGLNNWTGFKKIIDIADAKVFSPGGKRVSLKKMAMLHLGKIIQQGWHSSVQDASTTMQLFLKNKNQILKQQKIVKS